MANPYTLSDNGIESQFATNHASIPANRYMRFIH
jgi:hypothetical protein